MLKVHVPMSSQHDIYNSMPACNMCRHRRMCMHNNACVHMHMHMHINYDATVMEHEQMGWLI